MRKRPSKRERKERLASARAELALLLDDLHKYPEAMRWNLTKTRIALEHAREFGTVPFTDKVEYEQFVKDPVRYSLPFAA